jgi:hypothetical protein
MANHRELQICHPSCLLCLSNIDRPNHKHIVPQNTTEARFQSTALDVGVLWCCKQSSSSLFLLDLDN